VIEHRRFLVVDDERNLRRAIVSALSDDHHVVDEAATGEEASRAIFSNDYDLVIIEPNMPDRSGHALLGEIRRHRPKARVVVLTARIDVPSAVSAMKMGVVDVIEKPLLIDELRSRVEAALALPQDHPASEYDDLIGEARELVLAHLRDAARTSLAHAVSLFPQRPEAFNLFGAVAELDGERHQAGAFYRAALSLDPTYEPAQRNLERTTRVPPAGLVDLGGGQSCEVIA